MSINNEKHTNGDSDKIRKRILEALKNRTETFREDVRSEITAKMAESAVDKAMRLTAFDIAIALSFSSVFCLKCGNCCRICDPISVSKEDIQRIAGFLGIEPSIIVVNFTKPLKSGEISLKASPCIFLKNNHCSIYQARPKVCQFYPLFPRMVG